MISDFLASRPKSRLPQLIYPRHRLQPPQHCSFIVLPFHHPHPHTSIPPIPPHHHQRRHQVVTPIQNLIIAHHQPFIFYDHFSLARLGTITPPDNHQDTTKNPTLSPLAFSGV